MTTVFISWLVFILLGLILGYAFYKEFSDKKNNPEYLKDYGLEPKALAQPKEPEEKINLNIAEEIERIFVLILALVGSVLFFGLIGILGYAVIIFLIKFVRSNLTL